MKNLLQTTPLITLMFFLLFGNACSHRPTPSKIGDENINVPSIGVSKARSEALGGIHPSVLDSAKKCTCVQLWLPVCGDNGKTYSNSCFADCAGVKYKQGSCQKDITD